MKLFVTATIAIICVAFQNPHGKTLLSMNNKDNASHQFDFWIGDWDLVWNDTSKGTNTITREMDGFVLQENFHDPAGNFSGKSWTVYDTTQHIWRQTWVDNQGGYITLTGKYENNRMILATQPQEKNGKQVISRMVFYNIATDTFDWNWEHSTDGGTKWKVAWKIHYQRRK